jgi:ribosomal protein S25
MTIIFELEGGFVHEWASDMGNEETENVYKKIREQMRKEKVVGVVELVGKSLVSISLCRIITISLENS